MVMGHKTDKPCKRKTGCLLRLELLCAATVRPVLSTAAAATGLYGERVGAINFVSIDKETATKVLSQLKRIARAIWSNPPVHGASIAAEVVSKPELFAEWNEEMEMMAGRIKVLSFSLLSRSLRPGLDYEPSYPTTSDAY